MNLAPNALKLTTLVSGIILYPTFTSQTGSNPCSSALYFKPSPVEYFRTPVRQVIVRTELSERFRKVTLKNVPLVACRTSLATAFDIATILSHFLSVTCVCRTLILQDSEPHSNFIYKPLYNLGMISTTAGIVLLP